MRPACFRLLVPLLALVAGGAFSNACTFNADVDHDRFSCASNPDCGAGFVCVTQVKTGTGICFAAAACSAEVCDGLDNDCDGETDNEVPGEGEDCETGQPGICSKGRLVCAAGSMICEALKKPATELCNGLDDDCDGKVDEGFELTTDPAHCGACDSACLPGESCEAGRCVVPQCPSAEDGDGLAECADTTCEGRSCGANGQLCAAGVCGCPGGESAETSCGDGLDNDCDGLVDCADPDCEGLRCGDGAAGICNEETCET